jgi:NAD(P)-dependent dehydrogenase (short-subunit alcohol dehydrogenase family)
MASRAALVTGGSSGIGKALARVLGEEGYAVTIAGRDEAKLAAAAGELGGDGIEVQTAAGDVAAEDAVARIVAAHEAAHGRIDALVNAAAYGGGGVPLAQMPTEMLDRHLDVDLRAMFLTIRAALPMLTAAGAEHGKALVVNVSSLAAKGGTPGMTFYAAPGFTATPMAEWTRDAGVAAEEMVQPSDLGEGLRFLLRTSPTCLVREIEFAPPAQREIIERLVAHRSRAGAAGE